MSEAPQIIFLVCAILTMITAGPLILIFIFKKQSRTYGFRLVFLLFVFDFLFSVVSFISMTSILIDPNLIISQPLCKIQAALKQFAIIGSYFTTMTISWSLYTYIIHGKPIKKNPIEYFSKFNVILPLIICITPLILNRYDRYNRFDSFNRVCCTLIQRDENGLTDYIGITLKFGLYHIPFAVSIIFDMFIVLKILYYIYKDKNKEYNVYQIKIILLYPSVLLLSWIFVIFQRVFEIFSLQNYQWLSYIDLPFATLNGFFNAIIYGFFSLKAHKYIFQENRDQNNCIKSSTLKESKSSVKILSHKSSLLKESKESDTFDII